MNRDQIVRDWSNKRNYRKEMRYSFLDGFLFGLSIGFVISAIIVEVMR